MATIPSVEGTPAARAWMAFASRSGPSTYPARPINGGSLERALPKTGRWQYEPKYNGWRCLVHAPTGTMFSRYGQRLSIQGEFTSALAHLLAVHITSATSVEWFDCEGLERRHALGRGTLMVFDYVTPGHPETYVARKDRLASALPIHDWSMQPATGLAYSVGQQGIGAEFEFYRALKKVNRLWHCPFYEGLVAKREDSFYPVQLRSPGLEFAGWVKHRWIG